MVIIYHFKKLVRNLRDHFKLFSLLLRLIVALYGCFVAVWTTKTLIYNTWWLGYILFNTKFVFPPVYQHLTLYMLSLCCLSTAVMINIFFFGGLAFCIGDMWTQHGFLYASYHLGKTCFKCAKSLTLATIDYIVNDDAGIIIKNE